MSVSHSKYNTQQSPSVSTHAYTSSLNEEERERLRKKQSLKEILKNKREKSVGMKHEKSESKMDYQTKYDYHNYHNNYVKSTTTSPLMKYHRNSSNVFK